MIRLLLVWLINALALIAALVLGLVNALVRPVLVLLTLPVTILTLSWLLSALVLR